MQNRLIELRMQFNQWVFAQGCSDYWGCCGYVQILNPFSPCLSVVLGVLLLIVVCLKGKELKDRFVAWRNRRRGHTEGDVGGELDPMVSGTRV